MPEPEPRDIHRLGTLVLSAAMAVIGVAMVIVTIANGGGPFALGVILGVPFAAAGFGRAYLNRKRL